MVSSTLGGSNGVALRTLQAFQLPLHNSSSVKRVVAVYKNWFQVGSLYNELRQTNK